MLLKEENQKKISTCGTYYQDFHDPDVEVEVDVAEVVSKTTFICKVPNKPKPQDKRNGLANPGSSLAAKRFSQESGRQYSFDLSKADHIFGLLLKSYFIRLSDGHKIPPKIEMKNDVTISDTIRGAITLTIVVLFKM